MATTMTLMTPTTPVSTCGSCGADTASDWSHCAACGAVLSTAHEDGPVPATAAKRSAAELWARLQKARPPSPGDNAEDC